MNGGHATFWTFEFLDFWILWRHVMGAYHGTVMYHELQRRISQLNGMRCAYCDLEAEQKLENGHVHGCLLFTSFGTGRMS